MMRREGCRCQRGTLERGKQSRDRMTPIHPLLLPFCVHLILLLLALLLLQLLHLWGTCSGSLSLPMMPAAN